MQGYIREKKSLRSLSRWNQDDGLDCILYRIFMSQKPTTFVAIRVFHDKRLAGYLSDFLSDFLSDNLFNYLYGHK